MLADRLEQLVFGKRHLTLLVLALASLFLLLQAATLKIDAGFEKQLPLEHPYMQTFMQHHAQFGGANRVLVAVAAKSGDIFTKDYLATLKAVTDDVFFIPGVDRARVSSLVTPDVRFIEVDEQGFAGGNVMPAEFEGTPEDLAKVRENTLKSGQVGRLVANDFTSAMVSAQLLERDPATGAQLDYMAVADKLNELQARYPQVDIHIIGFAKMVGDVAAGAKGVAMFFAIAALVTFLLLLWYSRSAKLSLVLIGCAATAVVWQLGIVVLLGYGIDPMSILLPFLIFAIAVSHGVQMITAVSLGMAQPDATPLSAARTGFRRLLGPGTSALLTDIAGFLTLALIPIPMIRELAFTAALGVGVILVTNLVLLPVWLSYVSIPRTSQHIEHSHEKLWRFLAGLTNPRAAVIVLFIACVLGAGGWHYSRGMVIGDTEAGAPEFRADSPYNRDAAYITSHFSIGTDILNVIAETATSGCVEPDVVNYIDAFDWHMRNMDGVQSSLSLPQVMKIAASGWNEGNLKWRALPLSRGSSEDEQVRNRSLLTQASRPFETATGLLNADCSVMPVMLFLTDHKAQTLDAITTEAKAWIAAHPSDAVKLRLATGNAGVMAATNDAVRAAEKPMLLAIYAAIAVLCFLSFRSFTAVICCLLPLVLVSVLANALMAHLGIGLKVATLPIAALGVGIGVDYGIYIFSRLQLYLKDGHALKDAWMATLQDTGHAVLFTGLTLAAGVSTWIFSALKFQADMGLMLTFMFVLNMLAAIVLIPAIASLLIRPSGR